MRPVAVITAFSLFCIGTGYLWVESCMSIAQRNGFSRPTMIAEIATTHAPLLVLGVVGVVGWMAGWLDGLGFVSETRHQYKTPKHERPIGVGIAGSVVLFFFYIYSGLSLFMVRCGPLGGG